MAPPRDLILASTSPYRRDLLGRLRLPFRALAPGVDEAAFKALGLAPAELAARLAAEKALALAPDHPEAVLIGSDQLACLDDEILGKPGTPERAVAQLTRLAGREHTLVTALAVWESGRLHAHTDVTRLRMRDLSRAELGRYVAADRPMDCAGAYKLESLGIALFERVESADQTAIVGLPLLALCGILRGLGFALP